VPPGVLVGERRRAPGAQHQQKGDPPPRHPFKPMMHGSPPGSAVWPTSRSRPATIGVGCGNIVEDGGGCAHLQRSDRDPGGRGMSSTTA
jgi:hypothetical protein